MRQSLTRCTGVALALAACSIVLLAANVSAALANAWWHVSSHTVPSVLHVGEEARVVINATDVGDVGLDAATHPIEITDMLPEGLEPTSIVGLPSFRPETENLMSCTLSNLTCMSKPEAFPAFEGFEVTIEVNVAASTVSEGRNQASVRGGGEEGSGSEPAPLAQSSPVTLGEGQSAFGIQQQGYGLSVEGEDGSPDTQAGSHPFQLTTRLDFNQTLHSYAITGVTPSVPALAKELSFKLPPGLIGDPQAVPECSDADFSTSYISQTNACSPEDAIGVALVNIDEPARFGPITRPVPLWNLEPAEGEPARFGFEVIGVPVVLDTALRSDGDYGVTVSVDHAPQSAQLLGSEVTIWGNPGDSRHDSSRGWGCLDGGAWSKSIPCQPPGQRPSTAFLTMPSSCDGPLTSMVEGQSWPVQSLASEPGEIFALEGPSTRAELAGFDGCQRLPFEPSLKLTSAETTAATPTGLSVDVHLPQASTLNQGALGEADLKDTSVTLPEGVQLSPASAGGLEACSEAQIGYQGRPGPDPLSLGASEPLSFSVEEPHCPDASKLGVVRVHTPLLPRELQGAVYLAQPAPRGEEGKNPFNSLLALYITARDPISGVEAKLAGEVQLNPSTGQITSTFLNAPQVPFEDFELEFFSGPRAATATPPLCGTYRTEALFRPWSSEAFLSAPSEEVHIGEGPDGSPCPPGEPFAPSLSAGSQNPTAGAFSSFALEIQHPDGNRPLSGIQMRLPAGVAAMLSKITPCPEAQAAAGSCGPESQIGSATAFAGFGPDPFTQSGKVYLTGPYQGAPFGLSIVTPAIAGPFDLGLVVVRSKIEVDPHSAQVTITGAIPTFLQGVGMPATGIPIDLKRIEVSVDREDFEFNPTSCEPKTIQATLSGAGGATQQITEPFQVKNCSGLAFKPTLTAQTQGRTSKANGASFDVKVTSSQGQANIAKTVLVVPKILPARLTTIQKACLARTFEANPASCPQGSNIGQGIAHTPVLKSPLEGPAYLVSHGNAAWPDVEFVLQGEGITLILDGQTAIKGGVTTSSFNSVPDAPVSSFEAILPQGPHSALTTDLPQSANYSLCGQKLLVPTTLTAHNGAVIKRSTKVSVSGCGAVKASRAKKLSRAQRLKRALASCRKRFRHSKARRGSCDRKARKAFGPKRGKAHGHPKGSGRQGRTGRGGR